MRSNVLALILLMQVATVASSIESDLTWLPEIVEKTEHEIGAVLNNETLLNRRPTSSPSRQNRLFTQRFADDYDGGIRYYTPVSFASGEHVTAVHSNTSRLLVQIPNGMESERIGGILAEFTFDIAERTWPSGTEVTAVTSESKSGAILECRATGTYQGVAIAQRVLTSFIYRDGHTHVWLRMPIISFSNDPALTREECEHSLRTWVQQTYPGQEGIVSASKLHWTVIPILSAGYDNEVIREVRDTPIYRDLTSGVARKIYSFEVKIGKEPKFVTVDAATATVIKCVSDDRASVIGYARKNDEKELFTRKMTIRSQRRENSTSHLVVVGSLTIIVLIGSAFVLLRRR